MPNKSNPMICPTCGIAMNEHAEKLMDPVTPEQAALADPALGGVIQEFHTCPGCGCCASRVAAA